MKKTQANQDPSNQSQTNNTDSQPTSATTDNSSTNANNVSTAPESDLRIAELTQDLQRTRADFENYRKQVELQRTQAMSAAKFATVEKFLPLVDDFERALSSYPEQLAPLAKSFTKTLSSLGLAKINSDPEVDFNPDFHDAISIEDGDGDFEVIAETLRPGYLYDGTVIRPAMVKVKRIAK